MVLAPLFATRDGTGAGNERGAILTDQPQELREYLAEARAVAEEWYSREGVEGSHEANIEMLAVLMGLIYLAQFWTPWLLWVAITLAVGGLRWTHPSVMCPERSVPTSRRVLGLVCVLVFVLTFMPVPFANRKGCQ